MSKIKQKPCIECGSKDIRFWDCGNSSFNPVGYECSNCGWKIISDADCSLKEEELIKIWNNGQNKTKKIT